MKYLTLIILLSLLSCKEGIGSFTKDQSAVFYNYSDSFRKYNSLFVEALIREDSKNAERLERIADSFYAKEDSVYRNYLR
jgi:hypothetical protein